MQSDEHALALLKAYDFAREGVIWIALLLLIKGHTDLQAQVTLLQMQETNLAAAFAAFANGPTLSTSPNTVTWPGDGLGNLVVSGDLTVMGCMLWQQEVGLFQNSCSVLTSLVYDCIHGVPYDLELNGQLALSLVCACEPHWTGPLCDMHDCYGRGVFELNTGLCECMVAGYTASSMCKDRTGSALGCNLDLPIPPGESNCYGQCVNGQCICTKPGQLGLRCMQCAYPEINSTNCPGRTNWGLEYIDPEDEFAVCGGGYEFSSSDIVVMRGVVCNSPNCEEFRSQRTRCCNPLALEMAGNSSGLETTMCPNWKKWTFNRLDFGPVSIFNDQYRLRYLQILLDHNGTGCSNSYTRQPMEDCLRRSYNAVQTSDWPLLELDRRPMRGYVIYLNGQSLGLDQSYSPSSKLLPSLWSMSNTTVYLQGTGTYPVSASFYPPLQRDQLYFVVIYLYPNVYCLSERDADKWTQLVLSGSFIGANAFSASQMYWINLLDQPGVFLPMHGYCGQFAVADGKFRRNSTEGVFPGSRANAGYWWTLDQGTVLEQVD